MRIAPILSIACVFSVALASRVGAEMFRSDTGRFSVEIPAGFVRFNAARLAMVKARAEKPPKELVHEGFDRPNAFGGDGSPFILIQEVRERFVMVSTHDQVQRALDNEFRKGFDRGGGGNAKLGAVTYDRAKCRFIAPIEMRLPNGGQATGVIYGFLGKDSVVLIQCIGLQNDLPQHQPDFDRMADTFRYDEGFQFAPLDTSRLMWIAISVVGGLCCLVTLVVVVIAAIVMMTKSAKGSGRKRGGILRD